MNLYCMLTFLKNKETQKINCQLPSSADSVKFTRLLHKPSRHPEIMENSGLRVLLPIWGWNHKTFLPVKYMYT